MESVIDKKDCCGCALCFNICPTNAIEMVEDEFGFTYPKIDKNKCIECGLCKKKCIYSSKNKKLNEPIESYVASSKDNELIMKSASGGIFASLARRILQKNGVVYGATLKKVGKEFEVKHIRIENLEGIKEIQGSKYIQSDIRYIYKLIDEDLKKKKKVLFSGTPCQVDAVKQFFNKINERQLFTIDIICHGVPNIKMFNDYIRVLEKKEKGLIDRFCFRDKTKSWGLYASFNLKRKGKVYKKIKKSYELSFYQLFLDSEIYRKNCYYCPYAGGKRAGDITIGDYWEIEKEHPEYLNLCDIKKGVSCILINTEQGKELFSMISNDVHCLKSEFSKVKKHNAQLEHPSILKENYEQILKLYKNNGYESIEKYYIKKNFIKILIKKIWYIIPEKIRKKLK